MPYEIRVQQVESQVFAGASERVAPSQIPARIIPLLDKVWAFLKGSDLQSQGLNVAVYLNVDDHGKSLPAGQVLMQAGVLMPGTFTEEGEVRQLETPGGRTASTTHVGPYDRMGDAHSAIVEWCAANGCDLQGTNWEVYGHWIDDPAQLRTDVFYLLK
ncbi:MAG TPA: GyrI-like domain-containing protein [Armatimonadota bacterium]|jgi:effector-binding domain-containing protein